MEELCYTVLGIGLGIFVQQIHQKLSNKKKQNKTQQQYKGKKYNLLSTPDMKKAYQEQKQSFLIKQASQQEIGDTIRKIVKIQNKISSFDKDDELNLIQNSQVDNSNDDQSLQNSNENQFQPKTPNFNNKSSSSQYITLTTSNTIGFLQSNQFSDSKTNISPPCENTEEIKNNNDPE
ncbi:unnamed protein product [Paramecium sonneborni]|uniref:Uncharacterized protein n=1 Tax=Paramecium sonneborni TaxID=65129 RepID=A0A8S1LUX8_9CILI|nr:unnamed protein product [Paramecium sonneborni]